MFATLSYKSIEIVQHKVSSSTCHARNFSNSARRSQSISSTKTSVRTFAESTSVVRSSLQVISSTAPVCIGKVHQGALRDHGRNRRMPIPYSGRCDDEKYRGRKHGLRFFCHVCICVHGCNYSAYHCCYVCRSNPWQRIRSPMCGKHKL